jgi:hypothetical protein
VRRDGFKQGLLFLKKKRQKIFCSLRESATAWPKPAMSKSFLLLFFKKEVLACFFATGESKTRRVGWLGALAGVAPQMDCFAVVAMIWGALGGCGDGLRFANPSYGSYGSYGSCGIGADEGWECLA